MKYSNSYISSCCSAPVQADAIRCPECENVCEVIDLSGEEYFNEVDADDERKGGAE